MKVIAKIKDNESQWEEELDISSFHHAQEDLEGLIVDFNTFLKVGELPRELVSWRGAFVPLDLLCDHKFDPIDGCSQGMEWCPRCGGVRPIMVLNLPKDAVIEQVEMPVLVLSNRFVDPPIEWLKFMANGDIYVRGNLTANDMEVVDGMREMFKVKDS